MAASNEQEEIIVLNGESELRFVVNEEAKGLGVSLLLINGSADILGSEIFPNKVYNFPASSSVTMFTWQGCHVKLTGQFENLDVKSGAWYIMAVNMHGYLEDMRVRADENDELGPVCMVVGPSNAGKTFFCYTLLNYAARVGKRPVFVDLDVGLNSLSLPGSISVLPIRDPSDALGKFDQEELAEYYFGHNSPGYNLKHYFLFLKMMGPAIRNRIRSTDSITQSSGMIIDTCGWIRDDGYRSIVFGARSFGANVLFVLEDEKLFFKLKHEMQYPTQVILIPKYTGIRDRDRYVRSEYREKRVQKYFYGPRGDFKPCTIEVSFEDIHIFTVTSSLVNSDAENVTVNDIDVEEVSVGPHLERSIIGLSAAERVNPNLSVTNVIGFLCIVKVDMEKRKITLLSPKRGPLPSNICILGHMKLRD